MRKIERINITNFKGARRVDVIADPTCNEIAGKNEQGKSSTLDAIMAAIAGPKYIKSSTPLTHGASKGAIELDLGDLLLKRTFNEKNQDRGGRLKVTATDGTKWGQREVDALFGTFTFDPLKFSRMRPADQVTALQQLAGQEFVDQLAQLDGKLEGMKSRRPELKRDLQRYGAIPNLKPVEPIDPATTIERIREHEAFDRELRNRQRDHEQASHELEQAGQHVLNQQGLIAELEEKLAHARLRLTKLEEDERLMAINVQETRNLCAALPEPEGDLDQLRDELARSTEINSAAAAWREAERKRDAKRQIERELSDLERDIERTREERVQLQRSAQLPVDGLTWGPDGIALNGVEFSELADSRKLRLSATIGMSVSPNLRIMFIRDGSLLDDDSFAEMVELCREHSYQLWIETVGEGHENALIIEEGVLDNDDRPL
jgi:DNA repair exonuclease SbcCD ATPase subunit